MRRTGNPSIPKIMFAHIALLGFQRADGSFRQYHPPFFVTTITLHRLSAFASGSGDFFHGKATPNILKQNFDVSESTHFIPILQETP